MSTYHINNRDRSPQYNAAEDFVPPSLRNPQRNAAAKPYTRFERGGSLAASTIRGRVLFEEMSAFNNKFLHTRRSLP